MFTLFYAHVSYPTDTLLSCSAKCRMISLKGYITKWTIGKDSTM